MDYKKVLLDCLIEAGKYDNYSDKAKYEALKDYFVSAAKKANRDEFIEPERFINDLYLDAKPLIKEIFDDMKKRNILYYLECVKQEISIIKAIAEAGLQLSKPLQAIQEPERTAAIPPQHFTRPFTDKERQIIFEGLVSGGFIPKDTNYNNFCHVFGGDKTADFEPLQWNKTKQLARELLMNEKVRNREVSDTEIQRKTPLFFIDTKGNPMKLAKNKPVLSIDSDELARILATI